VRARLFIGAAFGLVAASPVLAAEAGFNGGNLSPLWIVPFAGILLSIAVAPVTAPSFWHHHFGKTSAFWALAFLVPFAGYYGVDLAAREVVHTLLAEYVPFIILLLALFTVSGGIHIRGNLHGSARLNTGILALGTALASVMGTTGAAMLLIRPLLRANDNRRHRAHVVMFFIFLVANIGGALTPLGDPPLFLGFLKGVDFFWTTKALLWPTVVASALLLALFYAVDAWFWRREGEARTPERDPTPDRPIGIDGKINFVFLLVILAMVMLSGVWKSDVSITIAGTTRELPGIVRDGSLLAIAWASWRLTPRSVRHAHHFTWEPIVEVAKLFAGIFLTIIPAIAMLRAGSEGALAPVIELVSGADGRPNDALYFWVTGALSSFLDNAPTYLVFFNLAGGDAAALMGTMASTLTAISLGAVFMGANTYIGNAPNFMVKAIAEARGVRMPSFFAYLGWAMLVLMPIYALITLILF
jgi:Na+/H+ antiporter NhaD/arsenite permease-like protein